jgi:hypothetical protein
MMAFQNRASTSAICILITLVLGIVVLALLPPQQAKVLVAEGGLIENLSVAVLGAGMLCAGFTACRTRSRVWLAVSLMLLWMYLRELDYQKHFTPRSIESIGFYTNGDFPLGMKIGAVAALLPFACAGVYILLRTYRVLRSSMTNARPWVFPAMVAAGLFVVGQIAEKVLPSRFHVVEETAELAFVSLLVFIVFDRAFGSCRRSATQPSTGS